MGAAENTALIQRFYEAFDQHDGDAMAASYAPGSRFEDPVFGRLTGAEAGAMWRMFTARPGSDLRVELREHEAGETAGTAHWIARYTFAPTGKMVVNDIHAQFRFAEGLVAEHVDSFSFWSWARQAFGPPGMLLGWIPIVPAILRRKVRADLATFMNERDLHDNIGRVNGGLQ